MRFVLRIKITFDTFEFQEELFWKRVESLKESHGCTQEALIRSRSPSQRWPPVSLAPASGARFLAS